MSWYDRIAFSDLAGKTLVSIDCKQKTDDDYILFTTDQGEQYKLYHDQDCCESVDIDDIVGDLDDLISTPILYAEEISQHGNDSARIQYTFLDTDPRSSYDESYTWTFYKLATVKGSVTIKWYGSSNGYYSESVSFEKVSNAEH
jgi:hypothetical protein